jgi:Mg-chelatase subunit ChlD
MTALRLPALSQRIERLSLDPAAINAPLVRLARPLLNRIGWQPVIRFSVTPDLIDALKDAARKAPEGPERLAEILPRATDELESNVLAVERASVINRRVLLPQAAWLRRLHDLLARAWRLHEDAVSHQERHLLAEAELIAVLPPLAVRHAPASEDPSTPDRPGNPSTMPLAADASPLVDLQLALVDRLVEAARAEGEFLERRRRLLEGARRALLDAATAMPLEVDGVELRQRYIAAQISRLDRIEAAGVVGGVRLLHQIRQATDRGDAVRVSAGLWAAYEVACSRQDERAAELASKALNRLWGDEQPRASGHIEASLRVSADELLGPPVIEAILRGYQVARTPGHFKTKWAEIRQKVDRYLEPGAELATLRSILAVDGCFEVGGVLAPTRVEEQIRRWVAVRFPTAQLALMPAQDITDLRDAVVEDPRTLLYSLATGRLLARRFLREETTTRRRTVLQGEVRVFLLDGSGSMIGHRARVRDAILLAELATLAHRAREHGRQSRVALYFQYFSDTLEPAIKVDSARAALDAIEHVTATMRQGGTNLQAALLASYDQILRARAEDPDLVRAQIVLITDGEAPIDEGQIDALRAGLEGLPVGISVIALGEENEMLRALVARQRSRGERAFYHHLPDPVLRDIEAGTLDGGPALHLPASLLQGKSAVERAEELSSTLSGLLDEMISLERQQDDHAMERALHQTAGLEAAGLTLDALGERERARLEELHQDRRALGARFDRWFPSLSPATAPPPGAPATAPPTATSPSRAPAQAPAPPQARTPGTLPIQDEQERSRVEQIAVILAAIADLLELGGTELSKQRDAIEVLEHLLPQASLTPAIYHATLLKHRAHLAPALTTIRTLVRPPRTH